MDMKEYKRLYYLNNRDRLLSIQAERRKQNPDLYKLRNAAYRTKYPEKHKAANKKWMEANPRWKKNWVKENLDRYRAYAAQRKAARLRATPKWANEFFIQEAYHLASLRTKVMGFPWEVDHIVPLVSKTVCGLHVEHNLRVIPAVENARKGNRYWPHCHDKGMP